MTPTPISVPLVNPATPVTFQLQGTGELDIRSIVATWDGSGAAADFYPVLSVYTSDDRLISRTRLQDAIVTAGDTVVMTFGPFLRRAASATPAAGALHALRLWTSNMALTIGTANDGRASYDNVSSFDSTVFGTSSSGGRIIRVTYKKQGWYSAYAQVVPTAFAAGTVDMHYLYVGDTLSGSTVATDSAAVGLHVGPYPTISVTRYFPDEFDSLNAITELWIAQNSGVNMTINQSNWMHVYHGDSDF